MILYIAFYLFQKFFIAFLKNFLPERSKPKKIIYFLMVLHLSTKTEKTFSICAITEMISAYQRSGIFQPLHMEKVLVMLHALHPSLQLHTQRRQCSNEESIQLKSLYNILKHKV